MKRIIGISCALLIFAAAAPANNRGGDKMRLKLKGPRTVFMKPADMYRYRPASVRLRAELEGTPDNPEEYYCLEEEWDWGDETESLYEPDCDPYEDGAELKRIYSASHTYRNPGSYTVYLRLMLNKDTIIAGRFNVRMRGQ